MKTYLSARQRNIWSSHLGMCVSALPLCQTNISQSVVLRSAILRFLLQILFLVSFQTVESNCQSDWWEVWIFNENSQGSQLTLEFENCGLGFPGVIGPQLTVNGNTFFVFWIFLTLTFHTVHTSSHLCYILPELLCIIWWKIVKAILWWHCLGGVNFLTSP